ncbi:MULTISPECIES: thioredoxin family protein [Paenibacillus]|uniref:thioredoxin family protein n=1 Tax=Paenibacillus TaxID=44249 RepID=UPI0004340FBB|nr:MULTISPECIES: thioredoxin family protein [Paenibacillus]CDN42586.1 Thioredoxin-like protein YusE [Paenibacillus sp. P22]
MALTEMNENTFLALGRIHRREALFFSTPLCGTCRVAERLLEAAASIGGTVPVSKININFAPKLREKWQIRSVPALVILENGQPVETVYAMQSAAALFMRLKKPGIEA